MYHRFCHFFGLFLILSALSGCYLPGDFDALLEIDGKGRYRFSYQGELMSMNILQKIAQNDFKSQQDFDEAIAAQIRELKTKQGISELEWIGDAKFQLKYEKIGFARAGIFYFLKKQSEIFSVRMEPDPKNPNLVLVKSHKPEKKYVIDLTNKGYRLHSTFKVKTNAKILESNAEEVVQTKDSSTLLTWHFSSLQSPSVRLLLEIEPYTPPVSQKVQ